MNMVFQYYCFMRLSVIHHFAPQRVRVIELPTHIPPRIWDAGLGILPIYLLFLLCRNFS